MDNPPDTAMVIVKLSALLLIGVMILSAIVPIIGTAYSYTMTLTDNPTDGDTLTIGNRVYEFDVGNGVLPGHIQVIIADSLSDTSDNLSDAISNTQSGVVV